MTDVITSPNADLRKCKAKAVIYAGDRTEIFESEILSATLIREYKSIQDRTPVCELNIDLKDENGVFDVLNANSIYYKLSKTSYIEFSLSTTSILSADEYITKCRYQFYRINLSDGVKVSITAYDPFGFGTLDNDGMTTATNRTDGTAREIVNYIMKDEGYVCRCVIPDEINGAYVFDSDYFYSYSKGYLTRHQGLFKIATGLTKQTGKQVIMLINDDGNLEYRHEKETISEILTEQDYIKCSLSPPEGTATLPIVEISDRGNILRQLSDRVKIVSKNKTYTAIVFRIAYRYSAGVLAADTRAYMI